MTVNHRFGREGSGVSRMFPSLLVTIIFAESRDLEPHRTIIYYLYIFGTANHVKDVTWDSNKIYIYM